MKIAVIASHACLPPRTGYGRRVLDCILGLQARGHEVAFIGLSTFQHAWNAEGRSFVQNLCPSFLCLDAPRGKTVPFLRIAAPLLRRIRRNPFSVGRLDRRLWHDISLAVERFLAEQQVDFVWIHDVRPLLRLDEVLSRLRCRVLLDIHDLQSSYTREMNLALRRWPANLFRKGARFGGYRSGRRVASVLRLFEPSDLKSEVAALGTPHRLIVTSLHEGDFLRNFGLTTHYLPPVCAPAIVPRDGIRRPKYDLGVVGGHHFFNVEGLEFFLEHVMPLVLARRPQTSLAVAGAIGTAFVGDPRLGPKGGTLGAIREIGDFYADVACVLVPLLGGSGSCIKTIEALLHGKPVISMPAGVRGLPENIKALVPTHTEAARFAAAICETLDRQDLAAAMADKNRSVSTGEYSLDRFGECIDSILS
jgi:hypothetical protein